MPESTLNMGFRGTPLLLNNQYSFIPNYALLYANTMSPVLNLLKFRTGLLTSNSNNVATSIRGELMMNEAVSLSTEISLNNVSIGTQNNNSEVSLLGDFMSPNWEGAVTSFASSLSAGLSGLKASLGQRLANAGSSIYRSTQNLKSIKNLVAAAKEAGQTVKGAGTAKAGNIAAIGGAAADLLGTFLPEKSEYSGKYGSTTQTIDNIWDGASDAAMMAGPVGMIVGGAMKGASFLSKGLNALGNGTDAMTSTDAILGSSFLSLTPIGMINGFGGKKTDTIVKDNQAFETVGSSYTGTNLLVNNALEKSGKKYGLLSSGARNKANREIAEAKIQLAIIQDISDVATDKFNIRSAMAAINGNRRAFNLLGGYDLGSVRVGRQGLKVNDRVKSIVQKCKKGKKIIDPFQEYLNTLPENLRDSTNYRVRDFWEYNGRPKNFEEAKQRNMFILFEDGWHAPSVAKNPKTGELEFMKSSSHPTHYKEIEWYNSDNGAEFRSLYELIKTLPYWKYIRRLTPIKRDGGTIEILPTIIELVEEVPEFQNGGSINVIPDGALHARKHNMDIEGITKKGIPVVSEKDGGELELQAEIEMGEVIIRLEVTLKLEELCNKYYSEDSSNKEKEGFALEAGKLLVDEILNNTVDNTNNLL